MPDAGNDPATEGKPLSEEEMEEHHANFTSDDPEFFIYIIIATSKHSF